MSQTSMTCADCDELFPDWFEEQLDAEKRASVDAHVSRCARCQGLIRDIDGIRDAAASLSDLAPSRDLWQGIEARIQPSVVSIAAPRRDAGIPRAWLAAAAAALVVVTSSVTYVATSKTMNGTKRAGNAVATGTPVRVGGAMVEAEQAPAGGSAAAASQSIEPAGVEPPPVSVPQRAAVPVVALASRRTAPAAAPATASEVALAGEIGRLQMVLRQRRSELEPATVKIVEDNLEIIDAAVSQARSALARDPASGFLNERLEDALQKKMELLRTVALLRSST